MEHRETLTQAARILTERANDYGTPAECFSRIASIASTILGRTVSRYEVAVILASTKMGRATESSQKADTWIDAVNYLAFCNEFVNDKDTPVRTTQQQLPFSIPQAAPRSAEISQAINAAFDNLDAVESDEPPAQVKRPPPIPRR